MKRKLAQIGYVTRDLEKALDYWIDVVGAGPFFYADYEPENQVYRGAPTHIRFRNAYGYLGGMQVEVIQQLTEGESAYTEALSGSEDIPLGGLPHHVALLHDGYDEIVAQFLDAGAALCYDAFVEGAGRFCYLDTRRQIGSFLELIEHSEIFEAASERMRLAHEGWDGTRPRRSIEEVMS